jgi:hypothetical protein
MNLQYISDSKGQTTGVFIPINDWNDLKMKYKDIELEENTIPQRQKDIVIKRLNDYRNSPELAMDFDSTLDNLENDL